MASATSLEEAGDGARLKVYTRKKLKTGSRQLPAAEPEQNPSVRILEDCVSFSVSTMMKPEISRFRLKLSDELKQVRDLLRKVEEKELEVNGCVDVDIGVADISVDDDDEGEAGLVDCEVNVVGDVGASFDNGDGARRVAHTDDVARVVSSGAIPPPRISVTEYGGYVDKEKRTPKANQYYQNSEFIVGKEKFPPANKKMKVDSKRHGGVGGRGSGFGLIKHTSQVFKNCGLLLTRLMKHKHGWVFNAPVDVEKLQLHDYFLIIKQPMDLGTVKTRLNENWYRSPREFVEDVRLTFRNAMTYNPDGNHVHAMAKELSQIFEDRWAVMETQYSVDSWTEVYNVVGTPTSTMKRVPHAPLGRDRHPDSMHLTPQPVEARPLNRGRPGRGRSLKKPKANDQNKRDMTFEEKQKLSKNLETLPSEKLDSVVEVIKRRNASLLQQEDSIEVDIDSVDAETLWDLDRLVTNYKKSLSKLKRKRELAMQAREYVQCNAQEKKQAPATMVEASKETKTAENRMGVPRLPQEDKQQESSSRSSSSSSASSRSGTPSSDSDSGSSSGSDTGHSPRD